MIEDSKQECGYCGVGSTNVIQLPSGHWICSLCYTGLNVIYPTPTTSFIPTVEKLFAGIVVVLKAKNADYSNGENPFSNFENTAKKVGISVEQGILVRINDKVERICNLLGQNKTAKVTGESVNDTICDAIGYLAILYAFRMGQVAPKSNERNQK